MKHYKRWAAGLLAAVMLTAVSLSSGFAAEAPFAEFRLDASDIDKPSRDISVDIYHRDESGQFRAASSSQYSCTFNRVTTRDARFFIQPNTDGVWVSVDYLTDVNGDGTYELLEDPGAPVWDVMDSEGGLFRPQPGFAAPVLPPREEQAYLLSSDTLLARSRQAVQERMPGGSCALEIAQDGAVQQQFPLCMVKLHRTLPDKQEETLIFYLQLYGDVLVPFDVSPSDQYYDAVCFVLSQNYFSGVGNGLFRPEKHLPRAQLAQVLWSMAGSPEGAESAFSDVPSDQWYYKAVSWCQQEGLIVGYTANTFGPQDLLSREQMLTVLCRYAEYVGSPLNTDDDLSRFSDAGQVSSWAQTGVRWAASNGLLANTDGSALGPKELVTRGELAAAIYAYAQSIGLRK